MKEKDELEKRNEVSAQKETHEPDISIFRE